MDLGSNSARLALMEVYEDRSYRLVSELREPLRLAQHLSDEWLLSDEAAETTVAAAAGFARYCESHGVEEVRAVATSAVRSARNGPDLVARIQAETGLSFDIISGEQEALYGYVGVVNTLDVANCMVLDVGGGSAEVVRVEGRRAVEVTSLPLGAISLTNGFLDTGKLAPEKVRRLERYVADAYGRVSWIGHHAARNLIQSAFASGQPKGRPGRRAPSPPDAENVLVGLGGTVRAIARMYKREVGYPLELLHGMSVPVSYVGEAYQKLRSMTLQQRREVPGVSSARADIIVAGVAAVYGFACVMDADRLVVSGRGLRDGVLLSLLLGGDARAPLLEDPGEMGARSIMRRMEVNQPHAEQIAHLALALFDQLADVHRLGPRERRLLRLAALLHDVGSAISFYNHDEHGFYLLTRTGIDGLPHCDLALVAYLVAAHARDISVLKRWPEFRPLLEGGDEAAITPLAGILRFCELLERTESGNARSLHARRSPDGGPITLRAVVAKGTEFELKDAKPAAAELGRGLGVPVSLEVVVSSMVQPAGDSPPPGGQGSPGAR
jgi:exopolyphosphatase/guanosine-5'-triphosphate,3'-diphosphate pyrophosphatase